MPEPIISNPLGAFGQTDLQTEIWGLTAPFKASAAVTAKSVVAIGTDGQVATAATNGTASLTIGVSQQAIASGSAGLVVVLGMASAVAVDGAVARGDLLKRSATTAGRLATTATPAAGEVVAVAINASAGGVCDVWVNPAKVTS